MGNLATYKLALVVLCPACLPVRVSQHLIPLKSHWWQYQELPLDFVLQ